jgi:hypothetical protein
LLELYGRVIHLIANISIVYILANEYIIRK